MIKTKTFKIVGVGDGGVGGTTLFHYYTENRFNAETRMTIGVEFFLKEIELQRDIINLQIFDFAGQERFRFLIQPYILGAKGAILSFDLTRPMTLENLGEFVKILRNYDPHLPIILIGTKLDVYDEILVDDDYVMVFMEELDLNDYIKVSSKTGENVNLVFELLLRRMLLRENYKFKDPTTIHLLLRLQNTFFQENLTLIKQKIQIGQISASIIELNDLINRALYLNMDNVLYQAKELLKICKQNNIKNIERITPNNSNLEEDLIENDSLHNNPVLQDEIIPETINSIEHPSPVFGYDTSAEGNIHFKINNYITLKLENMQTNIYVKDKRFIQCKYLLLDIPTENIEDFDEIDSIDEAAKLLNHSLEGSSKHKFDIAPEVEFWGHCSNLQAWAENRYDTRLLHSNIAFPLLKKLTETGDPLAKRVFKEEIAERFSSGYQSVITYLINQD